MEQHEKLLANIQLIYAWDKLPFTGEQKMRLAESLYLDLHMCLSVSHEFGGLCKHDLTQKQWNRIRKLIGLEVEECSTPSQEQSS